jgi:membrane protease YdiL (CAAX protease family)
MWAIGLLAAAYALMWLGQTAVLLCARQPLRPSISSHGMPRWVKQANRLVSNAAVLCVILAYPLVHGQALEIYYLHLLPLDDRVLDGLRGFSVSALYLAVLYLAWLLTDNLRFSIRHGGPRLVLRLAVVPFSAVFGAIIEELLFRGVVVADLLRSVGPAWSVVIGSIVFALAHYVRPVKRYWTFVGHLALGVLLCTAFVWARKLWLPMGLHAGGIFLTLGARPFVRYTGPPWLFGASIFPYAGLVGTAALAALTLSIWMTYGGSL